MDAKCYVRSFFHVRDIWTRTMDGQAYGFFGLCAAVSRILFGENRKFIKMNGARINKLKNHMRVS